MIMFCRGLGVCENNDAVTASATATGATLVRHRSAELTICTRTIIGREDISRPPQERG